MEPSCDVSLKMLHSSFLDHVKQAGSMETPHDTDSIILERGNLLLCCLVVFCFTFQNKDHFLEPFPNIRTHHPHPVFEVVNLYG